MRVSFVREGDDLPRIEAMHADRIEDGPEQPDLLEAADVGDAAAEKLGDAATRVAGVPIGISRTGHDAQLSNARAPSVRTICA